MTIDWHRRHGSPDRGEDRGRLWRSIAELCDLVLPRLCAGCERPGAVLCLSCRGPGVPFAVTPAPIATFAAGVYDGGLRSAIVAYKERGRRELARPLSGLLAGAVARACAGNVAPHASIVTLVPVPSSRAAARQRGGAHLPRLVRRVARRHGLLAAPAVLSLRRAVRDSVGLSVVERRTNVSGAMAAAPVDGSATALLVDDLVTTGATLAEAARALRAAGWNVAGAAVVAAALRHSAMPDDSHRSPTELAWFG